MRVPVARILRSAFGLELLGRTLGHFIVPTLFSFLFYVSTRLIKLQCWLVLMVLEFLSSASFLVFAIFSFDHTVNVIYMSYVLNYHVYCLLSIRN